MSFEEFLALSNDCKSIAELGRLFVRAIGAAGYQNASFVRVDGKGFVAAPFLEMPAGFVDVYFGEHCDRDDAVLDEAARSVQPFFWADLVRSPTTAVAGLKTFEVCREAGAHSGLSLPFHGPDGAIDLIGVSLRDEQTSDLAATGKVVALASVMRWRYWQIRNAVEACRPVVEDRHVGGPDGMTSSHCRALVLVDLAERRRRLGFMQMAHQLFDYVSEGDVHDLLSWGQIVEEADDTDFRYHYVASPLGANHMANCTEAAKHRRAAWDNGVPHGR